MPTNSEKRRRKELIQSQREERRRAVRDTLPAPAAMMKTLFSYVDTALQREDCDNTLRNALEFIASNYLDEAAIVEWLERNGGYCDCEAINNAEEVLEDVVPGYHDLPEPTP